METLFAPVQQKERIAILDVTRGIALCGILILNIYFFARPVEAMFNLHVCDEFSKPNIYTWYITNFLLEGSFRALFSMLFGAGVILLISRLEKSQSGLEPADIYYRRLIWLMIFGIIDAYILLWPGDILFDYAVCGLILFPLRKVSKKLLLGIAIFFICVMMFKSWLTERERYTLRNKGVQAIALQEQKQELTEIQKQDLEKWNNFIEERKPENIRKKADKEIESISGSYLSAFEYLTYWSRILDSTDFYDTMFFDVMIFMLFGMVFFKNGILTAEKPVWLYAVFLLAGYFLGIGWGVVVGNAHLIADFDFFAFKDLTPFPVNLYQVHRLFVAMGHIGLIMLLWKSGVFNWLLKPFANIGQMAFTNYLMQTIICNFIFLGPFLGYYGKFQRYELWYFVIGVWIFQLLFSALWLKFFSMGPLEWAWRSLTYWRIQSISKNHVR